VRRAHAELAVHRVAEHEPVLLVEERDRVVESVLLGVRVRQRPVRAAVRRTVDARRVAGAGAHEDDDLVAERLDVAEVERLGARGSGEFFPRRSVGRAEDGAAGAAGPGVVRIERGEAAELGGGGGLDGEPGRGGGGEEKQCRRGQPTLPLTFEGPGGARSFAHF
jgi:hypothetical protein